MAARSGSTITVTGYMETARALGRVNRRARATVYAGLRRAAEPIAADARGRLAKYRGLSVGTIKPSARVNGVYVVQRAKKVTGKRPDFGALQMTRGLIPALDDHAEEIMDDVEDAFLALKTMEGF